MKYRRPPAIGCFALAIFLIAINPSVSQAQQSGISGMMHGTSGLSLFQSASANQVTRESRCLQTGRVFGAVAGSSMGLFVLYQGIKGDDIRGPFWRTLAVSIPTTIVGAWVGMRGTEWATRRIMKTEPGIGESALRGMLYGALDGALIGTAGFVTLFTIAYLTDAITFNKDMGILGTIGMATLGGAVFGGMTGASVGLVYGPGISIYMKF